MHDGDDGLQLQAVKASAGRSITRPSSAATGHLHGKTKPDGALSTADTAPGGG